MAKMTSNHTSFYIERAVRTQKKEYILSLIKASYFAEKNASEERPLKTILIERLTYALALFRDDVTGYCDGIGGYSADQFDKDYTVGHEMAIWKNSNLELNDYAKLVAEDKITIVDYFDRIFTNYFQPVNNSGVHPLYNILNYLKTNNRNEIKKEEASQALGVPIEGQAINGLFHYLGDTSYFEETRDGLRYISNVLIEDLIKKCNIRYIGENYTTLALTELNTTDAYNNYISSEIDFLDEQEEKIDDIKFYFREWLINSGKYKPVTIKNYVYYIGYITKKGYSNIDFYLKPEIKEIELLIDKLKNDEKYKEFNRRNDYNPSSALIAYRDFLLQKNGNNNQNYYVISIKNYSSVHKPYFDKYGYMYWREVQSRKYNIGDTIYLYFSEDNGKEITRIKKKVIVEEINVPIQRLIDEKYYNDGIEISDSADYFIKVKLESETDSDKLLFKNLKDKFDFNVPQTGTSLIFNQELIDYIELEFNNNIILNKKNRVPGGLNKIYHGVPGCGKSYTVDKAFNDDEYHVFRTTFHPEYTNSDFVGQIVPSAKGEKVEYNFHPGAFTNALEYALNNETEKVCLIIEEINRGNASAIFGDIFQLLDRDKDGNSKYKIFNGPIQEYLVKRGLATTDIYIPSNMWIIATMNTSDQNVFTLDTAFKRRWKMEYIKNEFANDEKSNELRNKVIRVSNQYPNVTWEKFVSTINNHMLSDNNSINAEDKQLGVYFVTLEEVNNQKEFAEKVLSYLWEDVAKLDKERWFGKISSYEELLEQYEKTYLEIFEKLFDENKKKESNEQQITEGE